MNEGYPNLMCFGQDLANCPITETCERYEECSAVWMRYGFDDYKDEFEPGRVNVNMFGLNP